MKTLDFLQALYGYCETGYLTVWTRQDQRTYWFSVDELDKVVQTAQHLCNEHKDVYFGVGIAREKKAKGRPGSGEIAAIPGVWIDIDIADIAIHAKTALPTTTEEARVLLDEFPLEPSILVHSGHGLHGYWLFKEPWVFDNKTEREQAALLVERFQAEIQAKAKVKGWKIDSTHDLARVLRLPGTMNFKSEPMPVLVIDCNDIRYCPSDISDYCPDVRHDRTQDKKPYNKSEFINIGPASLILENCIFMQYCKINASRLPEPEWYAMVTNLARAEGGSAAVHELSKPYPKYSAKETDEKIKHGLEEGHPHTCEYIQRTLGFTGCPEGGCNVQAPCGWALSKVIRAKATIGDIGTKLKDVFKPEIVGALAILKKEDPGEYAELKAVLKGKVNLNDLERAVNKQVAENQKLHLVQDKHEPPPLEDILPDVPVKELRLPPSWTFNEHGIRQTIYRKNYSEAIIASPVPVLLTRRLRNIDTSEEKVEMAFYRDKGWHYISAKRAAVFNRQGLIELGNKGLPVSSESCKHLIRFLDDLERENLSTLPVVRTVGHMGWVTDRQFMPGAVDDIELDVEEGTGAASVAAGYREEGLLEKWIELITPLRQYPLARFMLAASFAAPLLRIVGQRVFIVHNWGPSRGGKTAALKAALSVWGNPEDLMASFNATKVGLERLASFYSDLPLGIDERQVVGDKQGFVEGLVYMLGLGKGKVRGNKGGSLQQFQTWRTIALTTGEEPLSNGSSTAGVKTRTLELYGLPIGDEALAAKIHDVTREHFGLAGPAFVRRLLKESPQAIKQELEEVKEALTDCNRENIASHVAAIATVCLADYYASQWVFGLPEEQAGAEANALAQYIAGILETAAEVDDGQRAQDFVSGWLAANMDRFDKSTRETELSPVYGFVEPGGRVYVLPELLKKALKEAGFSPERILRDMADRDLIETTIEPQTQKRRFTVRKRWRGQQPQMILFKTQDEFD